MQLLQKTSNKVATRTPRDIGWSLASPGSATTLRTTEYKLPCRIPEIHTPDMLNYVNGCLLGGIMTDVLLKKIERFFIYRNDHSKTACGKTAFGLAWENTASCRYASLSARVVAVTLQ